MARAWPWSHGLERTSPAARISARVRLHEAIDEAQSSLAQFSGIPIRSRGQRWRAVLLALAGRFAKGGMLAGSRGPAAWATRLLEWNGLKRQAAVTVRSPGRSAFPFSWPRLAAHAGLLSLVVALLLAGGLQGVLAQPIQANEGGMSLAWRGLQPTEESTEVLSAYASVPAMPIAVQHPHLASPETFTEYEQEDAAAVPQRTETISYTVQAGDTLISIAAQFGLRIETLYWFNELESADMLSIDQVVRIPPGDGLMYVVEEGDTLDSIAEDYKVRKGNMIAYAPNNLCEPYALVEGQEIYVLGASKPIPRPAVSQGTRPAYIRLSAPPYAALPGGERFSWPAMGRLTDRFGWTGTRWHTGIDIAASWGTPIYSAAAGTVVFAGWRGSLGYMVSIDHGEGWQTRYGHMAQQPDVVEGQWVDRGQLIGYIGCTGWCTGPHVHFEILYGGAHTDPLDYLY